MCFTLFAISVANSQTATDLNFGSTISYDSINDEISIDWWGKNHFYFFVTQNATLADPWVYFPYAVLGSGAVEGIALDTTETKMFFQLRATNDINSPLLQLDFDGDLVGTADELNQGTDPFLALSLDGDSIPDDWEFFHGLDTTPGIDSSALDTEPDGMTVSSEFSSKTDPNYRDHPDLNLELH